MRWVAARWRGESLSLSALVISGLALLLAVSPAVAGPSPGIAPSTIAVEEPIGQGDEIRLPSLSVSNLGDETAVFIIDVTHIGDQEERVSDPAWFRFDPQRFELEPGKGQSVSVRMDVPRDAQTGDYRVLLRARAEPGGEPAGGTVISAAVATTLTFTVENRNFHFYDPVTNFFQARAPYSYIGLALLEAASVALFLRRRFRFRFSVGVDRRE